MNEKVKKRIKKILGIPLGMQLSKESLEKTLALRWQKIFYKKKYTSKELMEMFKTLGVHEGSCVFIHSAWDSFFNYEGSIENFIDSVLELIGPTGTLAMPAFPYQANRPLNLKKSITGAGFIAERFRRYPGVKRSINTQHSVCAIGPLSDYLLSEHHLSETCCDEKSPYFKLSQVGAITLCIGLGYNYLSTSVHCIECINRKSVKYYSDFFKKEKSPHYYVDYDGNKKEYYSYDYAVTRRYKVTPEKLFLKRYFHRGEYDMSRISNLTILAFYANKYIPRLISLGEKGIDPYRLPLKKGYKF